MRKYIMKKVNFAFYVSGRATRLCEFLKRSDRGNLQDIIFVFTDEPGNIELEKMLQDFSIKFIQVAYKSLEGDKNLALSEELLEQLQRYNIGYCFSFGAHLLKGRILQIYKNRIINFHPSLLPLYPGRKAIDQAVEDQRALLLGNTVHFVDGGIDTGKIIMQSVMPITRFFDGGYDAVLDVQVEMLIKLIAVIRQGRLQFHGETPVIAGADYTGYHIYPQL